MESSITLCEHLAGELRSSMLRLLLPALRSPPPAFARPTMACAARAQSSVTGGADRGDGHDAGAVQARQAVLRLAAEQNIGPSLEDLQHKFAVRSARCTAARGSECH